MQNAKQPNSWRVIIRDFVTKNDREDFNPVSDKANMFNKSIMGVKEDSTPLLLEDLQDVDELKEAVLLRQTEINDKKAIENCDLIFFFLDERIGHGTMKEFDWAYDMKKPIMIVRTLSRKHLAHWNKWRRYFGLVVDGNMIEFKSLVEVKEFFIKHLGFKDV